MSQKIIRDPLYDYIAIDSSDRWILGLIDSPEFQRLQYTHQLGVSYLTYPGATHTRFSHSLGVYHLIKQCLLHLQQEFPGEANDDHHRKALLAAGLLHDIGHGPFSHLLEPELGGSHEDWTLAIISSPDTTTHKILQDQGIAESVVALLKKSDFSCPHWQKSLISSQLDMDRIDYLMRDSLFSGVGYGKFDWYRLINTMQLQEDSKVHRIISVWPDKSKYAIEEYIFSRFYMYQSVYFHKCSRGFEMLLRAIWRRAKQLQIGVLSCLKPFFFGKATVHDFLALSEYHVLCQVAEWMSGKDPILSDLCRRFLNRDGLGAVETEADASTLLGFGGAKRITQANEFLRAKKLDPEYYLLEDAGEISIYRPYKPEVESTQQDPMTAIHLYDGGFVEISQKLKRLQAVTRDSDRFIRYYCPKEHRLPIADILKARTR
jgi:HD superfamily phosphohydrolase